MNASSPAYRAGLAALVLSLFAATALPQEIPEPASVLGQEVGADFFLASYDEALAYMRALDEASDELQLVPVGRTSFGLDWYIAVISSAENLANLERHKEIARRLAHAQDLGQEQARALAAEGRAIVHIDGALHASEVACAQHTIQLAHDLVADPENARILDEVILVLWFSINPDGQNMIAEWYRQNLGTPFEVSGMPWLYQKYVGHDNNRDGYMNNMLESQVVTRTTLEYNPQVFYNQHQTAPFPARIWIPPFAEPVSSNVNPRMWRWVNVFGTAMAAYLDDNDMPGAIHRGTGFDNWYPGFIDNVNSFRNTVSFLTETALYRLATPHFYTLRDFPSDSRELRAEVFYASPWQGGWWRLGDAVRYCQGASMAVLDTASRYREQLLYNRYRAGRDAIERGRSEPPYAWVVPAEQWDPWTARILVEKLAENGVEVRRTTAAFTRAGVEYGEGSYVVLLDQAFGALARELFEIQDYPELREGDQIDLPYDVAGWTLHLQMGVDAVALLQPVGEELRATLEPLRPRLLTNPPAPGERYLLSRRSNAATIATNRVLAAGGRVELVTGEVELDGGPERGALLLSGLTPAELHQLTGPLGLTLTPAGELSAEQPLPLAEARVGLLRPWSGSIDEGWTRWLLEQHEFPLTSLYNEDVLAGHLRERLDVIAIPDMGRRSIVDGLQTGTVPPEYAGGIGEQGLENLRRFVREGGTLVAFNGACEFAISELGLPVKDALDGLSSEEFFCGGSLVEAEIVAPGHPLTLGMPESFSLMFSGSPGFETEPAFRGRVLARYPSGRKLLRSGFLIGQEHLEGVAAAVEVEHGEGRVVLLGFRPQWRGQTHGTYKLIFNALFHTQDVAERLGSEDAEPESARAVEWKGIEQRVDDALQELMDQNRAMHAAEGDHRAEASAKFDSLLAAFRSDRLGELEDFGRSTGGEAKKRVDGYHKALRNLLVDLRSKDLTAVDYSRADLARAYSLDDWAKSVREQVRELD